MTEPPVFDGYILFLRIGRSRRKVTFLRPAGVSRFDETLERDASYNSTLGPDDLLRNFSIERA